MSAKNKEVMMSVASAGRWIVHGFDDMPNQWLACHKTKESRKEVIERIRELADSMEKAIDE